MLTLVFLGRLEDLAGAVRAMPFVASLGGVIDVLEAPLAEALRDTRIRVAVNGVLATHRASVALNDGDEIAFLPPASGG